MELMHGRCDYGSIQNLHQMLLRRLYSTNLNLKGTLQKVIPAKKELFQVVKSQMGQKSVGTMSVASVIGGMRGCPALLWEASRVDPEEGIRFHGRTIETCKQELPGGLRPEAMFWLLLTGEVPSEEQAVGLSNEMMAQAELPEYLVKVLDSLPKTLHPMAQLSIGISTLSKESKFAKAYEKGIAKNEHWEYVFDDSLNLISKLPALVGKIYSHAYHNDAVLGQIDASKDWGYNLASCMGMTHGSSANINNLTAQESDNFTNLVRLYCALHGDHEGGNVSAHATHLVGSALSDPFLSYSAGVQGLAGPLHGLAAQEVVRFVLAMREALGDDIDKTDKCQEYIWSILNSKRVIPGYGHGVLRKPDPRFQAMVEFGDNEPSFGKDPNFKLVKMLSEIVPEILTEHGKTKNPYPNVDSASGVLFYHYGVQELLFFTVVFGASRALGPLAQLIWDRILGLPIERPKSIDLKTIQSL